MSEHQSHQHTDTNTDAHTPGDVTQLLHASADGDQHALEQLWNRVYNEVHAIARSHVREESDQVSVQATLVVSEVYLKLNNQHQAPRFENRRHFFGAVANAIRQLLIDNARHRGRIKRGGNAQRVDLTIAEGELASFNNATLADNAVPIIELIDKLAETDGMQRAAEVVRLRFILGLTVPQTAATVGVSERTVKNDWAFARAWILEQLNTQPTGNQNHA